MSLWENSVQRLPDTDVQTLRGGCVESTRNENARGSIDQRSDDLLWAQDIIREAGYDDGANLRQRLLDHHDFFHVGEEIPW